MQAILKTHDAQPDRTVLEVGIACLGYRVIIDVDHVIQHAHGRRYRALELVTINLTCLGMCFGI